MNKQTALWVMVIGAALSAYDYSTTPAGGTGGDLYGVGKPLESLRWNVYSKAATTTAPVTPAKNYYLSISDAAALAGAYFYFL